MSLIWMEAWTLTSEGKSAFYPFLPKGNECSPGESIVGNRDWWMEDKDPQALEKELGGFYFMQGIHKMACLGLISWNMSRSSGEEQNIEGRDDDTVKTFESKFERKSTIITNFLVLRILCGQEELAFILQVNCHSHEDNPVKELGNWTQGIRLGGSHLCH